MPEEKMRLQQGRRQVLLGMQEGQLLQQGFALGIGEVRHQGVLLGMHQEGRLLQREDSL
jgi:hypothetical protein